jgi:signal transduction histidine kinase
VNRLSLRARLLLLGTGGLAVGLALGGWLLLVAFQASFVRSVDAGADRTSADVAALISADRLPQPVAVAGNQLVQVVDGQNRVRSGSPGVDLLAPLLDPVERDRVVAGRRLRIDGARAGLDGPLRVSATSAGPVGDRLVVVVAVPLGDIQESVRWLRFALLALFVPLVAGLAAVAWWVIGWTLRPVEALRLGAEEITGGSPAAGRGRLPVPAGGDEIHRLAVTLNGMLDRLDDARARQRRFVADAAHELRNPLAGMRTQLEVAQRHPAGADWPELAGDLLLDTRRLSALAADLLLLARIDDAPAASTAATDPEPLAPALHRVAARHEGARVPVRVVGADPAAGEVAARIGPDDLDRLLTNLVDNAVRHARSRVELAAGWAGPAGSGAGPGRWVRMSVRDDGPGIPEADRERVFDRFTRLDDARAADEGGTGLGLAIVAELVRRAGGEIRLDDAGPGLVAEVLLPAAPGPEMEPEAEPVVGPEVGLSPAGPGSTGSRTPPAGPGLAPGA